MVSRERVLLTILAVAAEKMEFDGLLRHASERREENWPVQFGCSGKIGLNRWLMTSNGPGPKLAAEAVRTVLSASEKVDLLLSIGWCGALHPHFSVGDVFAASVVFAGQREFHTKVPKCARPFLTGRLISQDRFIATAAEKNELHVLGAQVVEMEAASVALAAEEHGLPFSCVRVISDTALEDFPIDFNRFRDAKGRFDRKKIALRGLLSPFRGLPNLIRMGQRGRTTSKILGDFLADCQF